MRGLGGGVDGLHIRSVLARDGAHFGRFNETSDVRARRYVLGCVEKDPRLDVEGDRARHIADSLEPRALLIVKFSPQSHRVG